VTVADDCVIGANSVVLRDLPAGSTAFGVPARPVNLKVNESSRLSDSRPSQSEVDRVNG
jgi:serine acetyltransferase